MHVHDFDDLAGRLIDVVAAVVVVLILFLLGRLLRGLEAISTHHSLEGLVGVASINEMGFFVFFNDGTALSFVLFYRSGAGLERRGSGGTYGLQAGARRHPRWTASVCSFCCCAWAGWQHWRD